MVQAVRLRVGLEVRLPKCTCVQVRRREQPDAETSVNLRTVRQVPATGAPRVLGDRRMENTSSGTPRPSEPRGQHSTARSLGGRSQVRATRSPSPPLRKLSGAFTGGRNQTLAGNSSARSANHPGSHGASTGKVVSPRRRRVGMLRAPCDTMGESLVGDGEHPHRGKTKWRTNGGGGQATHSASRELTRRLAVTLPLRHESWRKLLRGLSLSAVDPGRLWLQWGYRRFGRRHWAEVPQAHDDDATGEATPWEDVQNRTGIGGR